LLNRFFIVFCGAKDGPCPVLHPAGSAFDRAYSASRSFRYVFTRWFSPNLCSYTHVRFQLFTHLSILLLFLVYKGLYFLHNIGKSLCSR
jgi:hypothetical protein